MSQAVSNQDKQLKNYTLLALNMGSFLTAFMGSAINVAVPSIGQELHGSTLLLSWVVTGFILATVAVLVPFGRLADITGRKRVFTWGISVFAAASLLCALSWSVEILIFFRILQGIGAGMIFGTSMAILTSVFPPQERGKAIGLNVSTVYLGLSLGPVLGGIITHQLGWIWIFLLGAIFGALTVAVVFWKLKPEWVGVREGGYDLTGAILYGLGLVAFVYGATSIDTVAWAKYICLAGVLVLFLFVRQELRVAHPVFDLALFRNSTFTFSNLAALINYSATFALTFLLSLYLQVVRGYDAQTAGLILLFQPIVMAVFSPFTGRLSDRVEPRTLSSLGMAMTTAGLLLFAFLGRGTPLALIIANLVLLGTGFALFSSPNSNAVMSSVEKHQYGLASSTLGTMRVLGQAMSMATMTLILAVFVGNRSLDPAHAQYLLRSMHYSFLAFTVVCFAGIFASLARGKVRA